MKRLFLFLLLCVLTVAGFSQRSGQYRIYSSKRRVVALNKWIGDTSFVPTTHMTMIMAPNRFDIKVGDTVFTYRIVETGNSFYESSINATVTRFKLDSKNNELVEAQLAFYEEGKEEHTGLLAIKTRESVISYRFRDLEK